MCLFTMNSLDLYGYYPSLIAELIIIMFISLQLLLYYVGFAMSSFVQLNGFMYTAVYECTIGYMIDRNMYLEWI